MPLSSTRLVHPSLVLGAYLERMVRGRRVAVLGDATIGLAERLIERGARLVHAYDPDAARTAEAIARAAGDRGKTVSRAVLEGDLGVRDGAFDVVVVPDLALFNDRADLLRRARRLVGTAGTAVVASPNPEASRRLVPQPGSASAPPTYYELYDLVSLQFPVVRMIGQAPFVGYTVADFAAGGADLEVSVDASLLETTEEPEWFVAVASERKVAVDAFVVVELPLADVREALGAGAVAPADTRALAEVEARASSLATELSLQKEQRRTEAHEAQARATSAEARVAELESRLDKLKDVDTRAGDAHVRAERLTHQIRDLEEELRRQRDRGTKLTKQLEDEKKARTKAEVELGLIRGKPEAPSRGNEIAEANQRIAQLEAALEAARSASPDAALAKRVAELEASLSKVEQRAAEAEAQREAAEQRAEALALVLADEKRARETLAVQNEALEKRVAQLGAELAGTEALSADLDALEAQLRDRGHRITELERQLREGERVGKELLEELEALRAEGTSGATNGGVAGAAGGGGVGASLPQGPSFAPSAAPAPIEAAPLPPGSMPQLDFLADRAARAEADLQAARWRITQLEQSLAAEERGEHTPDAVQLHLEQALLAAHQELAALRRAVGPEGGHVAPGVIEQSVLLHQVTSQLGGSPP
jgi:SAM-dependent methyltransferase